MNREDQLGCDLLVLIKRVIDENSEIEQACRALAEAHGEGIVVELGIEASVIRLMDDDDEDDEEPERIPYAGVLSLTKRDENFLTALRIKP